MGTIVLMTLLGGGVVKAFITGLKAFSNSLVVTGLGGGGGGVDIVFIVNAFSTGLNADVNSFNVTGFGGGGRDIIFFGVNAFFKSSRKPITIKNKKNILILYKINNIQYQNIF
jgi:hypothetical protein